MNTLKQSTVRRLGYALIALLCIDAGLASLEARGGGGGGGGGRGGGGGFGGGGGSRSMGGGGRSFGGSGMRSGGGMGRSGGARMSSGSRSARVSGRTGTARTGSAGRSRTGRSRSRTGARVNGRGYSRTRGVNRRTAGRNRLGRWNRNHFGRHRGYGWRNAWLPWSFWLAFGYPLWWNQYYTYYDNSCIVSNDASFEFIVYVPGTDGLRLPPGGWIYLECGSMVDIEAPERDIRMTIGPIYDGMIIRDTGTRIVVD